jgi:hypothetical protein
MSAQRKAPRFRVEVCLLVLIAGIVAPISQQPTRAQSRTFAGANEGFTYQWDYSDRAVADGTVARTWLWGPAPLGAARPERMVGSPARGTSPADYHFVQYFDKARMEFNAKESIITNGRLVVEMMSGSIQTGLTGDEYFPFLPYRLPIAGDTQVGAAHLNTPTYASLFSIATIGGNGARATPIAVGTRITATYAKSGVVGTLPANAVASNLMPIVGTFYPQGDPNGHNIPNVFADFLTQKGPVSNGPPGQYRTDYLFENNNWVIAVGLPITEAYWAQVRIGGKDTWVMFQAFERRILTYNPSAADPLWRVEMGNVGQHYKDWRPEPLEANPFGGITVVQSSTNATAEVCLSYTTIDAPCPRNEFVVLPRVFLTTLRPENSWARTKLNGWMLLHSDNVIYDMQSSAVLVFKSIDNAVESVLQRSGRVDYLHATKRRMQVETNQGLVTTNGTRFSLVVTDTAQVGEAALRIAVPRLGGSVTLQPPTPEPGVPAPAPIVVQSGQVLIVFQGSSSSGSGSGSGPGSYIIQPMSAAEEQYWVEKVNRLRSMPGLEVLVMRSGVSGGPTPTATTVPSASTATPIDTPSDTTPSAIATRVPTQTPGGPTATPVPPSNTATRTNTATNTVTSTPTIVPIIVPNTPTTIPLTIVPNTATNTPTDTPTNTATSTATNTPTDTPTSTATSIPDPTQAARSSW